MRNFWKDGLSISEAKVSMLSIILIITFVYLLTVDVYTGFSHTDNLFQLAGWLIAAIAGVNVTNAITSGISNSNDETRM